MTIKRFCFTCVVAGIPILLVSCGSAALKKKSDKTPSSPAKVISSAAVTGQWAGQPNLKAVRLSPHTTLSLLAIPVAHLLPTSGIPESTQITFDSAASTSVIQPVLSECDTTGIVGAFGLSTTIFSAAGSDTPGENATCTAQLEKLVTSVVVVELTDVPVIIDHGVKEIVSKITVTLHP